MNARVVAAVTAAVMSLALTACSPSKEDPSDLPPGSEPDLQISAPSSAPPAGETGGEECAIDDFAIKGQSGREPKLVLPKDCTPPAEPLTKSLDPGEGPAAKKGDTVEVNYFVQGMDSRTVYKSWQSSTQSEPEQVVLGEGDVLPGWDEAMVGMKAGGRKLLVLPPEQGAAEAAEKLGFEPDEPLVLVIGVTQVTPG